MGASGEDQVQTQDEVECHGHSSRLVLAGGVPVLTAPWSRSACLGGGGFLASCPPITAACRVMCASPPRRAFRRADGSGGALPQQMRIPHTAAVSRCRAPAPLCVTVRHIDDDLYIPMG